MDCNFMYFGILFGVATINVVLICWYTSYIEKQIKWMDKEIRTIKASLPPRDWV